MFSQVITLQANQALPIPVLTGEKRPQGDISRVSYVGYMSRHFGPVTGEWQPLLSSPGSANPQKRVMSPGYSPNVPCNPILLWDIGFKNKHMLLSNQLALCCTRE